MLTIEIDNWRPVPKARARATKSGHHYTPQRNREAEAMISKAAMVAMAQQGWEQEIVRAIDLNICFYFPIPGSVKKADRPSYIGLPRRSIPDLDNLVKLVKDALNGVVWNDDAQVARITASKVYDTEPGCVIEVGYFEV